MKMLHIDNKYSIEYDDNFNDSPVAIYRYGSKSHFELDNVHVSLFYALLEEREGTGRPDIFSTNSLDNYS